MQIRKQYRQEAEAELEADRQERQEALQELRGAPAPLPSILDLTGAAPGPLVHDSPMMVAAPPHGTGGRPGVDHGSHRITLSAEEADIARRSGITYDTYAAKKLELQHRKSMDPERYAGRG